MRKRSITGPLLLLLIGALFLWRNLNPDAPVFDLISQYWPFVLIAWGLIRLVELLIWRQAWRGSFTGGEVVLVVFICLAGAGISAAHQHGFRINAGGVDWWGRQFDYSISAQASATGMKRIIFDNPRGNIRVTGGDGDQVTVAGHQTIRAVSKQVADRAHEATPVEIVAEGDRLMVRTNQDRARDNLRVADDLEVTVPRAFAVESRGRTGDYDISGVAGDVELAGERGDVRIARVDGNVRVEIDRSDLVHATDVKGNVEVRGRGADLDLENIAGQVTVNGAYSGTLDFKNLAKPLQLDGRNTELRAEAVPGSISMNLGGVTAKNLVGPVRLVTRSRDVRLEQFTKSLELESELGDVELTLNSAPLPSIEARSSGGSIEVVLPDKAPFQLSATSDRGEAVNDYGPQVERTTDGRAGTLKKTGEGPLIHLSTDRGTVAVRKAGTPRSTALPPAQPDRGPDRRPSPPRPPRPPSGTDF